MVGHPVTKCGDSLSNIEQSTGAFNKINEELRCTCQFVIDHDRFTRVRMIEYRTRDEMIASNTGWTSKAALLFSIEPCCGSALLVAMVRISLHENVPEVPPSSKRYSWSGPKDGRECCIPFKYSPVFLYSSCEGFDLGSVRCQKDQRFFTYYFRCACRSL
ncbi:hypothetical protein XELAEV_18003843mg, partial [Xenopus laevis]